MRKARKTGKIKLFVLAGMVVSLLSACGGNNTNGSASNGSPTASASSSEGAGSQTELTLFVDHPWWPLTDWSGKIPDEITKRTGIKIKIQVASDAQQLPLMIASGAEMPDLVYTATHPPMSNSNVSFSWDELIEKYKISDFTVTPMERAVNEANDGKLYTVRNGFMSPEDRKANPKKSLVPTGGLAVREDIMKELGNPKLQTLDDLVNIFAQVKAKYPDKTPLVSRAGDIDTYFRLNFGVPRYGFDLKDGKVIYGMNHPGQLEYYLFMNNLYRKGYITAENFTWKDPLQHEKTMISDKAFAVAASEGAGELINPQLEKAGKSFRIKQITNLLGTHPRWIADGNSPGWSGLYVPKQAKHPEAAIKFIQFMHSEEGQRLATWGIKDVDYTLNADGMPEFKFDTTSLDVQKKMGIIWWGILADKGETERISRYVPGKPSTDMMVEVAKVDDSNPLLGVIVPQTDSQEQVIKSSIDEMVKTEEMKIYLAKSEADAKQAYDSMIKKANDIGLAKLETWANGRYAEIQKRLSSAK